jgi:hypothetical protein
MAGDRRPGIGEILTLPAGAEINCDCKPARRRFEQWAFFDDFEEKNVAASADALNVRSVYLKCNDQNPESAAARRSSLCSSASRLGQARSLLADTSKTSSTFPDVARKSKR